MNMQELINRFQNCIDHGADPEQPVMIYDADAQEILEVMSFTYGSISGSECHLFCDQD